MWQTYGSRFTFTISFNLEKWKILESAFIPTS